ncbi:MAG: divergent polysaccharide deacetylase family protein [Pseudomonadota bacterium]
MGRGILFGAIWGFIVGGIILGVASLLGQVPGTARPEAAELEVPAGSRFDQAGTDEPVAPPADEPPVVAPADAPLVTSPEAPVAPTLDGDITASAAIPDTTADVVTLATPPAGASDSGVSVQPEEAPEEAQATLAPPADVEEGPQIDAEPPEAVSLSEGNTAADDEVVVAEEPPTDEVAQEPEDAPVAEATVTEEAPVVEEPTEQSTEQALAQADRPRASSGGFGNLAQGVTVNRPTDAVDGEVTEEAADAEPPSNLPAIEAFAKTDGWSGPDDRPLMSIIVIDETADASRLSALASFGAPLAFAVAGDAPGASEAMAAYRAAGHEVVLLANIPDGAQPADVEVAMEAQLRAVPESVAVLDGTFAGFRGNRGVAGQVAEILAETGHGLVTFSQGLNAATQIATQAGVPVGTVFRDLDDQSQGNSVIRRFLDQAAFRAGQDGQAILVARTKGETISALLIWQQQDRASRVNIAPLSALLRANQPG